MMIGLSRLIRAIADVPMGGMQTGSPKVVLKLADAERIKAELEGVISERDALAARAEKAEIELAKTANDYNIARERHDALAAQIEVLSNQLKIAHDCLTCADETGYVEDCGFIDLEAIAENISISLSETPEQCLREIRADHERDGFIAGASWFWLNYVQNKAQLFEVDKFDAACEHAEKVRQGGVE